MRRFVFVLGVLSLSSAGCLEETAGDLTGEPADVDLSAREFFIKKVAPEMAESCEACHAEVDDGCTPIFLSKSPEASYNALREYPNGGLVLHPQDSNLLLHGAHTGPAFSQSQHALVVEWLEKEVPVLPEKSQEQALKEFGDCMDFDVFDDSGVHFLAYQQSAAGGPCGGCHLAGIGGTWISFNKSEMFDFNTTLPWVKRWVKADFDGGNFVGLSPSNRLIEKPELATACGDRHVTADVTAANEDAIQVFVNVTLDAWRAGTCGQ
jgi:hypothetical protein